MFFKRKSKNRRLASAHVLDVKLSSSQLRANRLRQGGLVLSAMFGVVLLAFLVWRGGQWALDRFIYENDVFAIAEVDVQTDGLIAPDYLRAFAHVKAGENMLALDLNRVKRDLELIPWIQSAAVERILPRTLKLRITEREPVAQMRTRQRAANGADEEIVFQLDESGFVLSPLPAQFRSAPIQPGEDALPRIVGVNLAEMRPGRQIESSQLRAALRLIAEFEQSPMAGLVSIDAMDVTTPEVVRIWTSQGSEVSFSLNEFDVQLRRWRQVHDFCRKNGKAVSSLDLSVSNNLPLRFVDAATLPPLDPKTIKTQRARKKHV